MKKASKPGCTLQLKQKISNAHDEGIWSISWCQGSLVSGSLDGTVAVWDLGDSKTKYRSSSASIGVTSIVSLQDGSTAIACYQDSTIRFFDLFNHRETAAIEAGQFEAYGLSLAPGEDILASGSLKGNVNLWSMQEGHERVAVLATSSKCVLSTAFSCRGNLATSGMDGLVNVFDMTTQQIIHKLEAHAMPARSVAFSPEGSCLSTASDDRHVNLYDLRSGALIQAFSHESMAFTVAASPDGRHLASGCSSGAVCLWDLGMRRRLHRADTHSDIVWAVQFDPSSNRLASAGDDGAIQLYDIGGGLS